MTQTIEPTSRDLLPAEPYYQDEVHPLLMLPEGATFAERRAALQIYTKFKSGFTVAIDEYLGKRLEMTGVFQHWIKPIPKRINVETGQVKPAKAGWVRTVIFVKELSAPISLGSELVAEVVSDIITAMGNVQGMFPEGETVPFVIHSRGKRPDQYYTMEVVE